ncbi:MAG: hypothetical protein ACE5GK_01440 [Nitrospiria bacterium]
MTKLLGNKAGFTLIEVMALMIVVTFGLLALVSMQASALRKSNQSGFTETATQIVTRVGERILENGENSQAYDGMRTATDTRENCPEQTPHPSCLQDFSDWKDAVSALPKEDLSIRSISNTQDVDFTVDLSWQESTESKHVRMPFKLSSRTPLALQSPPLHKK